MLHLLLHTWALPVLLTVNIFSTSQIEFIDIVKNVLAVKL